MHRARRGEQRTEVEITGRKEATRKAKDLIDELLEPTDDDSREQFGGTYVV